MNRFVWRFIAARLSFVLFSLLAMDDCGSMPLCSETKTAFNKEFEEIEQINRSLKMLAQSCENKNLEIARIKYNALNSFRDHCSEFELEQIHAKQKEVKCLKVSIKKKNLVIARKIAELEVLVSSLKS